MTALTNIELNEDTDEHAKLDGRRGAHKASLLHKELEPTEVGEVTQTDWLSSIQPGKHTSNIISIQQVIFRNIYE